MTVRIPGPLRSYTRGRAEVEAAGATVDEVLRDIDSRYPGIRFRMIDEQDRIRRHIRIYVNQELADSIGEPAGETDEVQIICAISGGRC